VVGAGGQRLAKRDGGTTLAELTASGVAPSALLAVLGASLGLCEPRDQVSIADLAARFSFRHVPRTPWPFSADAVRASLGLPR
jgi:glutamyl-tRNA synthetase